MTYNYPLRTLPHRVLYTLLRAPSKRDLEWHHRTRLARMRCVINTTRAMFDDMPGALITVLVSGLLCAFIATDTCAFDGKRKGFILGGGLGLGIDSYTQEFSDGFDTIRAERKNELAIASSLTIGGAFSEQLLVYLHNQWASFHIEYLSGGSTRIRSGVIGLGCTYFTSPDPKGFFLTGTVGISYWDAISGLVFDTWTGLGVIGGVGYELWPHWSVNASLVIGAPERTGSAVDAQINSVSFMLMVTGLAY